MLQNLVISDFKIILQYGMVELPVITDKEKDQHASRIQQLSKNHNLNRHDNNHSTPQLEEHFSQTLTRAGLQSKFTN